MRNWIIIVVKRDMRSIIETEEKNVKTNQRENLLKRIFFSIVELLLEAKNV